jgi:hypothetical protein
LRRSYTVLIVALAASLAAGQIVGKNGLKKGEWKPSDAPEGWKIYPIARYQFQSDAPEARVKKVGAHLNAMFKTYLERFPTSRTPTKTFVVKIFKDRKGFLEYGAPPSAGAYYSWHDKEMVGYDTGMLDGELTESGGTTGRESVFPELEALQRAHTLDLLGVFAHEGWHQYFHWYCTSKIEFPSWCDEGIGEYFYSARFKDGKIDLGAPNTYRLGTIRSAIKRNKYIPLKDLVTFNQRKYYAQAGLAYAQGWSVVHFLMEHPDYKKQRLVSKFVVAFADLHSIDKAVAQVFQRMDWEKLEKEWKAWVLAMKSPESDAMEALRRRLEGDTDEGESPTGTGEEGEDAPASRPSDG